MALTGKTTMEDHETSAYQKARRKVKNIRSFYYNLTGYIVVISVLATINIIYMPEYLWFIFSAVGWGTGLIIHAMTAYNFYPFLSKDWEQKKFNELIEKETRRYNKTKTTTYE